MESYSLIALTHNFQVEVTARFTSSVFSHAGVASRVANLSPSNTKVGVRV